jgi:uncharacterized membrane protein
MSIAQFAPTAMRGSSRWLLLGSLAVNLFFIGVVIAMAIRAPAPSVWDRNVFVRIERMTATLPPADATALRNQIATDRAAIEATQTAYRASQETVREKLRQEPFDAAALRAGMAQSRAARQAYDQTVHGAVATAAAQMSPAGRSAMADWPPGRRTASNQR